MRTSSTLKIFGALAIGFATVQVQAQSWQPVGTAGFAPSGSGVCNWQQIEIDAFNNVYVAFNDEGQGLNNGQGTVMRFDGTAWQSIGTPGFTPGAAHHSSFALGQGDTVYYAFADGTAAGFSRASVMRYDGSSWSNIGSNLTLGECQYSNIVVTGDGSVYFASVDNAQPGGAVLVKKYAGGTTWNDVGPTQYVSGAGASYSSMTKDNNDTLYLAYRDMSEGGMVRVKKFNGTDWVNVGAPIMSITGPGASPAMDIHIAFNNNNQAYVAYSHGFQGPPRSSVHKLENNVWDIVGTPHFSTGQFETSLFNKLAFDATGNPYLSYQHGGLGNKASVMKFNGTTWVNVGLPGFSASVSAHNGIAIDGNDNPYVIYFDQGNGNMTTVMKYTVCEAPVIQTVTASETTICPGDSVDLAVTGILNDASDWTWYEGGCGGTIVGSGSTLRVAPNNTTTYYVRGVGECVITGGCGSVTVNLTIPKPEITVNGTTLTSSATTGNQWYLDGQAISGATDQQHIAIENGWYYVTVTSGNCVGQSDSVLIENIGIHGKTLFSGLEVYPVPFSNTLHIAVKQSNNNLNISKIVINDITGRKVFIAENPGNSHKLDLGSLQAGLYYLNVYDKTGALETFKIVKQ
jgi:hypothetical protein